VGADHDGSGACDAADADVFLLLQRYIVRGVVMAGLKG
jgi:hypothetical protein